MKKSIKHVVSLLLMLVLVFAMAVPTFAKTPSISKKSVTLIKGQTLTLKVNNYKGTVKWKTSNKAIATVSSKGKITAKKAGTVKITATAGKKKFYCTVKVEAPKLSKTSLSITEFDSSTLKLTGTKNKITWASSNKAIATVSSKGKVTAKKPGTCTISATVLKKKFSCKVTVKPGFTASDYSYVDSTKTQLVKFKFDPSVVTRAELEAEGFVVDGNIATKTALLNVRKYTFKKLPRNLAELKRIKLNTMFDPMAATIVSVPTWKNMPVSEGMYTHPIFDLFEYAQGALINDNMKISNVDRSAMYTVMQTNLNAHKYYLFDGASPSNNYTPKKPYTFTLTEGPYVIPAKNGNPQCSMILISFEGDDYQRYCDVYKSSRDGKWYCWKGQWKHMVAGVKDPTPSYMPANSEFVDDTAVSGIIDEALSDEPEFIFEDVEDDAYSEENEAVIDIIDESEEITIDSDEEIIEIEE